MKKDNFYGTLFGVSRFVLFIVTMGYLVENHEAFTRIAGFVLWIIVDTFFLKLINEWIDDQFN